MARPKKVGLEYFPLDCQMDDKIEMLEAEHGLEGFAVYIKLLQACYQIEDGKLDMSIIFRWKTLGKQYGIPPENLRNIVNTMLEIGLFDKKTFENEQKLTSNGIQNRMMNVNQMREKERKRKSEAVTKDENEFSSGKPEFSARKSTQSKVKEKESKGKDEDEGKGKFPYYIGGKGFNLLYDYLSKNFPFVMEELQRKYPDPIYPLALNEFLSQNIQKEWVDVEDLRRHLKNFFNKFNDKNGEAIRKKIKLDTANDAHALPTKKLAYR